MTRHSSIAENAVLYGLATALNYAFSFVTVFYTARVLQPEALGTVSFAAAVVSYFSLIASMGIPLYGMRSVAARRGDGKGLAQLTSELFFLGLVLASGASVLLAATVWLVPRLASDAPLLAILGTGLVLGSLGCDWLYKGLERYRFLLYRNVAVRLVVLALLVVLVRDAGDLYWYAALSMLSTAGCALAGFAFIPRTMREEGVAPAGHVCGWYVRGKKDLRRHIRPTLTFFLMSCATLIYANLDIVMLGFLSTPTEIGYYQIAAKAKVALTTVGGIIWNAALPQATHLWEQGKRDEFAALARKSLGFICLLQTATTLVFFACARPAVVLIAGNAYADAVPAFRMLLLSVLPIAISNILGGQVLIPAGKERLLLASEICGAAANLVLNFALIPSMGGMGAAISTVVAEVVVMLGTYVAARVKLHLLLFPWDRWGGRALGKARREGCRLWWRMRYGTGEGSRAQGYCPCCDTPVPRWKAGSFIDQPDRYDHRRYEHVPQQVLCPICESLPRHRIIAHYLSQHPELVEGKRILYFAPERSMMLWLRRHGIRVTTADLYSPADLQIDIQDTGLEDGSYDVVVCNHVLEHVDDWRQALTELHRVLTPNGLLICSFPIDPTYETVCEDASIRKPQARVQHFGQYDHQRVFGRDSASLLEQAGFKVQVVYGAELPERILPVVGPADYDAAEVFLCRRMK